MVNIGKLKGKIVEQRMTVDDLAGLMGIHPSTLYRRINGGGSAFTMVEVDRIISALQLSEDEARDIFLRRVSHIMRISEGGENMERKLLTRKEAAARLSVSINILDELRSCRRLAYIQHKPGGKVMISEAAVEQYLARATHPARAENETTATFRKRRAK